MFWHSQELKAHGVRRQAAAAHSPGAPKEAGKLAETEEASETAIATAHGHRPPQPPLRIPAQVAYASKVVRLLLTSQ